MKKDLYSCLQSTTVFLDLITDYATKGYFFWKESAANQILLDSKLASVLFQKSQSIVIDLNSTDVDSRLFFKTIINKISQIDDVENLSNCITERLIGDDLFNSNIYFSCCKQKDSESSSIVYLVAIKSSEYLHQRKLQKSTSTKTDSARLLFNVQTKELQVNDNWLKTFGYSREELNPINFKTIKDLIHPNDMIHFKKLTQGFLFDEHSKSELEIRIKHNNGNWICTLLNVEILSTTPDNKAEWIQCSYANDANQRKEKENESEIFGLMAKQIDYAVIMTNADGITTYVNEAFTQMTGYTREELNGYKPGTILQGKSTSKKDIISFRKFLNKKKTFRQDIVNYNKNGKPYDVSCLVTPVFNDDGEVVKYISLQRDITEEKKNKNFLETFKITLDQTEDCVFLFKKSNLQFFYVNEGAVDMIKYSKEELMSMCPYDIKPEYSEGKFRELLDQLVNSTKKSTRFKTIHRTKTGKDIPVEIFLQYINNESHFPYFLAIVHDISKRLKRDHKLNQLSLVAENTTDLVIVMDRRGKIEYVNESFELKTGYTAKDIIGKRPENFLRANSSDSDPVQLNRKKLKKGKPFKKEVLNYSKTGQKYWVSATYNPIFDEEGQLKNIIAIGKDISESKSFERSLKKEKDFLNQIITSTALNVVILDSSGKIIFANEGAEDILGLEKSIIESTTYNDPIWKQITLDGEPFPEEELPFVQVMNSKKAVTDVQHGLINDHGEISYISVSGAPFEYQNNHISKIIFSITDITERVVTQKQLLKTKNQMQSILKETSDVVYSISVPDNKLIYITPSIEKLTGYPQSYYYSDDFTVDKWTDILHEEDVKAYYEAIDSLQNNGEYEVELRIRDANNDYVWVLSKGNFIIKKDKVIRFDGYVTNINNRKNQENAIQEYVDIVESQNERLKNFTYIVSHDLRSHSSNIQGLLDLISIKNDVFSKNEYFKMLGKASNRLEDTLLQLNDIVSVVSSEHELVRISLNSVIDNFQSSFETMMKEAAVNFVNDVEKEIVVKVVPAFLDSIVTNLITNAIRYRDPNKTSFVRLFTETKDENVILGVEDNGLGLDLKKYGNKLFGMHKTFHNHKYAKGIGLFITKNQIESMGGKIMVHSEKGKGSTFEVYFRNGKI